MKTPQERSKRYERERRDASERHRRKLHQIAERDAQEFLEEHAGALESEERLARS